MFIAICDYFYLKIPYTKNFASFWFPMYEKKFSHCYNKNSWKRFFILIYFGSETPKLQWLRRQEIVQKCCIKSILSMWCWFRSFHPKRRVLTRFLLQWTLLASMFFFDKFFSIMLCGDFGARRKGIRRQHCCLVVLLASRQVLVVAVRASIALICGTMSY